MKKLMTVVSVAATLLAFGAVNGDELTSTGFETEGSNPAYVAGQGLNTAKDDAGLIVDDGAQFAPTWVETELEEGVATVTAYGGEGAAVAADVATATGVATADLGSNYLKLDGAPLISRYAQTGGNPVDIGDGLYIDTLVQFTAADPETPPTPDIDGGDKLCIWLADNEEDPTQCTLMVTAGFVEDEYGSVVVTNYATSKIIANNSWHHLQVKILPAIDSDDTGWLSDGFVVFIDGTAVTTTVCPIDADHVDSYTLNQSAAEYFKAGAYAIFPSMIPQGAIGDGTITSLSFQGSGAVDELKFTDTDPIPPTPSEDDWADTSDAEAMADIAGKTAQQAYGITGAIGAADATQLTVWATGVGNVAFSAASSINTDCFLLNIANNSSAADIEAAEAEFKVSIEWNDTKNDWDITTLPVSKTYNGTLTIKGSTDLTVPKANWDAKAAGDTFFYATLGL